MRIRTPIDLGALIRERPEGTTSRPEDLADKVAVSRQWIVDIEKGKPRAEVGLVLRTAEAFNIALTADKPTKGTSQERPIILDSIIAAARKKKN
jgi:HTH-type transcriptional regulator / antitoxin HipB